MSAPLAADAPSPALRVLVAAQSDRRGRLQRIVTQAGHALALTQAGADVALWDGKAALPDGVAVVAIGGAQPGQAGTLPASATAREIDAALRAVAAGLEVRARRSEAPGFAALDEHAAEPLLTPRELEVLACIAEGLTNKLIARRLDISLHTVKFHVESLLRKLGATTRAQALARAVARGATDATEL